MTATCPRCRWSGEASEIVEVEIAPDVVIRCCPRCSCEHVRVSAPTPSFADIQARLKEIIGR